MSDRYEQRMALVNRLRDLAEWWEAADWWDSMTTTQPHFDGIEVFVDRRDELAAIAKRLGRADKGDAGSWLYLRVSVGESARVDFNIPRTEVCDRVVVDTKYVPAQVIPAHDEEVVEWRCRSIFAEDAPA